MIQDEIDCFRVQHIIFKQYFIHIFFTSSDKIISDKFKLMIRFLTEDTLVTPPFPKQKKKPSACNARNERRCDVAFKIVIHPIANHHSCYDQLRFAPFRPDYTNVTLSEA